MRRVYTRYGFWWLVLLWERGLVIDLLCVLLLLLLVGRVWQSMSLVLLLPLACTWLAKQRRVWSMLRFLSSTSKNCVISFNLSFDFALKLLLGFWWIWMLLTPQMLMRSLGMRLRIFWRWRWRSWKLWTSILLSSTHTVLSLSESLVEISG